MSYPDVSELLKSMRGKSIADQNKIVIEVRQVVIPALRDALLGRSPEARQTAAKDVMEIIYNGRLVFLEGIIQETIQPLIDGLQDENSDVRMVYTDVLGSIAGKYETEEDGLNMLNPRLKSMVSVIDKPLVAMLDDKSPEVRLTAANEVKWHSDKSVSECARQIMIAALNDPSPDLQCRAASMLKFDWDEDVKKRANQILNNC